MHPPAARRAAALVLPAPAPVPALAALVRPRATRDFHHVAGSVHGAQVEYADLNACAWFVGNAGWDTRGPRRVAQRRGLTGNEDIDRRKQ